MPSYPTILSSNALLTPTTPSKPPLIAVLAGATSGVGQHTLRALVATGTPSRIYLIGRPSALARTTPFLAEMHALNPRASIIWTEGEISLLSEVRRICDVIKKNEEVVDLLLLTAGYAPFGARKDTSEGVEVAAALEYYGRVLFAELLMGCLRRAEAGGRVVSVLGGGLEREGAVVDVEDLGMRKEGGWSGFRAQGQYAVMNTLGLERLAEAPGGEGVTFVHAWPGLVSTGNVRRGHDEGSVGAWLAWAVEPLFGVLGTRGGVCGQRFLFVCTSAMYGGRGVVPWEGAKGVNSKGEEGEGLFLVNYKGGCTPNAKVLARLRETGVQDKVWEHTQEVLKPYL